MAEEKNLEERAQEYNASQIQVLEGLEAVRMREKEESVLTQLGLKRNGSYYLDEE